ncbi:hypothetical protein SK128_015967, partial [Halocaridina rubra]
MHWSAKCEASQARGAVRLLFLSVARGSSAALQSLPGACLPRPHQNRVYKIPRHGRGFRCPPVGDWDGGVLVVVLGSL